MRKIRILMRYAYRILILKSGRSERICICSESDEGNPVANFDNVIQQIITNDMVNLEAKTGLKEMLEKRVMNKGGSVLVKSSFADMLQPLFSFRHIELKMAGITVALVIALAIGPTGKYSINRNINPVILADTIIDSANVNISTSFDSAAF
jgi:hypothetical protein